MKKLIILSALVLGSTFFAKAQIELTPYAGYQPSLIETGESNDFPKKGRWVMCRDWRRHSPSHKI